MARFILSSSVKATLPSLGGKTCTCAEVAELADALHSGCSTRQGVEVRVLSSAPEKLFSTNLSDAYVTDYFCLVFRTEQLSNNSYASFSRSSSSPGICRQGCSDAGSRPSRSAARRLPSGSRLALH